MYITEQYKMYRFAHELVQNKGFDIIHINVKTNEIWLEKYERKTSKVIRLVHRGFDWKNHLKSDIASVFQRVKTMRKFFVGKHIEVFNIYIASYGPVDDWSELLKPMQLKEKNPIKMKMFYFTAENGEEESERLHNETAITFINESELPSEQDQEERADLYKINLSRHLYLKNKEKEEVFSYGKPLFTYVLIAFNLFMFMMLELNGSSLDVNNLIKSGAKYNPAIIDGEWWRIISSMFLHIGVFHLFMNMLALYYLGMTVERIYGSTRFLFIYFLAGIGGGLVSFAFNVSVSAGASGALFGLFGALLFFGLIHKRLFLQTMGRGLLFIVGLNIVFGFLIPQIDMEAHLGGLIFGFIAAAVTHLPKTKNIFIQAFSLLTYIVLIVSLSIYGVEATKDSPHYQLMQTEEQILNENYDEAIELATKGLEDPQEFEAEILFQRAYAYIELGENIKAITDLEKSIQINPDFPEAHYNLSILYYDRHDIDKAKASIEKAKQLKGNTEEYEKLYEKIMSAE